MEMNFKHKRFLQYQLEFYQAKEISLSARELYSFIYNHCIEFHKQGWCGLSNKKLAEYLKCSVRRIEENLKELREKDMIIIENSRKRATKTGESRQIHINVKNYLVEEIQDVGSDNQELERLKEELEALKKENSQLRFEQAQSAYITELGHSLIRTGFITETRYQEQAQELNHILLDFESWHKEGRDLTKACFNYWNAHKDGYIKNPVQYILTCIDASKHWINRKDRRAEEYKEELQNMMAEYGRLK